jgi:NAD(P)-dependent dehydrogenase (short-subunit alcohol dehydrogenase family)
MDKFDFSHLNEKVCVITGGSGVLGKAITEGLLKCGIKTAIIGTNPEKTVKTAEHLEDIYGTSCIGIKANVLDKESLINAKNIINEKLGKIDFLINGAGGNSPGATTEVEQLADINSREKSFFGLSPEVIEDVFALNFTGTLLPSMIFAEDMLKSGKGVILNISSVNSFRPLTKIPAYSAAKASVNNFTKWLSVHLAKTGIRVNAIAPGFFLTQQNRFLLIDEKTGEPTARAKKIIANTPVGHYGKPEDLQGVCIFLLSDLSVFINGVIIPVDGGFSAFGGV